MFHDRLDFEINANLPDKFQTGVVWILTRVVDYFTRCRVYSQYKSITTLYCFSSLKTTQATFLLSEQSAKMRTGVFLVLVLGAVSAAVPPFVLYSATMTTPNYINIFSGDGKFPGRVQFLPLSESQSPTP